MSEFQRYKAYCRRFKTNKNGETEAFETVYADGQFLSDEVAIVTLQNLAAPLAKIDQEPDRGFAEVTIAKKTETGYVIIGESTTYFVLDPQRCK